MKKSTEVLNLPIISIADGSQVGKVKSLVVNPEKGSIDFLTIDNEDWQVSVKAIPFKKVVGIGEYAVTVEHSNAIIDLNEIPIANQLFNKKIKIINTRVMTRKGQLLGEIEEYFVDGDTGNIKAMSIKYNGAIVELASEHVVTYGRDIVIVNELALNSFVAPKSEQEVQPSPLPEVIEAESVVEPIVEEPILVEAHEPVSEPVVEVVEETIEETVMEEVVIIEEPVVEEPIIAEPVISAQPKQPNTDLEALRQRQLELLNGKMVLKDIINSSGELVVARGTMLTIADIERVQQEGPSVLVELSMNVEG